MCIYIYIYICLFVHSFVYLFIYWFRDLEYALDGLPPLLCTHSDIKMLSCLEDSLSLNSS